jgi:hypothetical protein
METVPRSTFRLIRRLPTLRKVIYEPSLGGGGVNSSGFCADRSFRLFAADRGPTMEIVEHGPNEMYDLWLAHLPQDLA